MAEQDLLAKYLTVLDTINTGLSKLIDNEMLKRQLIITNDIEALNRMTQQEEKQLWELKNNETLRTNILRDLSKTLQIPLAQINSVSLEEYIGRQDQDDLKFYRTMIDLIKKNMQQLQDLNRENQALTLMALDYIDEMQHLILGEDNPGIYTDEENGVLEEHMRKSIKLIDKKV